MTYDIINSQDKGKEHFLVVVDKDTKENIFPQMLFTSKSKAEQAVGLFEQVGKDAKKFNRDVYALREDCFHGISKVAK